MNRVGRFGFGLAMLLAAIVPVILLISLPWWLLPVLIVLLSACFSLTRVGQQTGSVVWVGISTLPRRVGSSAVIVIGTAGVVGVLVGLLAMGAGFERTLKQTGTDDTVIILSSGAKSESDSALDNQTIALVSQAPQVLKTAQDRPLASPEQLVVASLPKKGTAVEAGIAIRGIGERAWDLWPHIKITAGRKFSSGLRELVVGKGAHGQFAGLDVGSTVTLDGQPWRVVGIFDSGDAHNSEVWGDAGVVASTYSRLGSASSLTLRLTNVHAFDALNAGLQEDPRLKVDVLTTRQYYSRQSESVARILRIVGTTIGAIMALGAIFGALNAAYTAIAGRAREIATLRAIGFARMSVIVSILLETMLLAAFGGALGAAVAWTIFHGFTAATMGAGGSQVVFAFDVSPNLLWNALKWSLAIGFVGGLLPAARAARLPISVALRAL